ncbi:Vasoactive intestinal polypeptide receptor 2 [Cricetulus griseus]|uniref:Vasoactive intestinal polypeptide receptor 2 n=1 Tax=Cricetulus griseus TaxID=10029 RepID=G3I7F0_CRIGR|nr:Vasoactive intestinal polypeptide receptor 2 [Cricetulus griseus]
MRASVLLTCCCWLLVPVSSIHPECRFHLEIQEEETKCEELLSSQTEKQRGCSGVWDNITCWRPADIGETVTVPCPKVFSNFYSRPGNISKNCTSDGWSETFPDFIDACGYNDPEDESKVGCKLSLVFFQYCIMANFYWLLVEGLYLHTLLVAVLPPSRCFLAYLLIGWGIPSVCIGAWTATRLSLEDTGRLAKSTLLLIPLFGVHYMVFAAFPIGISSTYQILFELCVGSFQGLVVAVLYCFLNNEVQCELKRRWRGLCLTQPGSRDYRLHSWSMSRNGSESALQIHRGSRTQSFLQTETSVI